MRQDNQRTIKNNSKGLLGYNQYGPKDPKISSGSFAKKLAQTLDALYVNITDLVKKHHLGEGFDRKTESEIVDVKKLNTFLIKLIKSSKKQLIIDGHLSHYLLKKYVEKCYIIKCDLKKLKKRLEKRNYSKEKIRENLDVEIFDVCLTEAQERGYDIEIIEKA